MSNLTDTIKTLNGMKDGVAKKIESIKVSSLNDVSIDELNLDSSVLGIPKTYAKYLNMYTDESISLKDLYRVRDKKKFERWKYYSGKQTNEYCKENGGVVHEAILKGDIDRYLANDDLLIAVESLVDLQKKLVDYIESIMTQIANKSFHIKAAIEWRRFTSMGG